ncbi:MAG: PAS domain S-box protein, partial [Caldiserica bacterium]|nr:PAS domain S-box protein [Caldisericota bacterium]
MIAIFARRNPRRLLRTALIVAAYLCAFIILDLISYQFEELRGIVAWYPPAGLTYALLLVFGATLTPAVTIALLISSVFIYRMPQPPYQLVLWALIISCIYGAAATFLRHRIRFDWQLRKSRDVTWLVVMAVFVSALLAVLSVSSSALSSDMPRNEVLRAMFIWWIGETVGVLTITPFLLIHVMPRLNQSAEGQPVRSPARRSFPRPTLSVIGQAFSIALMFYWVFGAHGLDEFRPMYLLTLPLIWIALDHGFKGVTTGIVVLNFGVMLAMWFFRFDVARLGELQLLTIVNCIVGLLMGAVVTERKRTEKALAENMNLLNEVQEVSHIGGWEYDVETKHLKWTQEVYRIYELPPDYDPNDIANDIQHYTGDDRKRTEEAFGRAATGGEPYDLELQFVTAKGNRRWVRTMGVAELKDGHPIRVVGSISDITQRKQAEQALRQSQDKYRMLTESIKDVVWIVDTETLQFLYVSPSVKRLRGYTPEEIMAQPMDAALTPESAALVRQGIQRQVEDFVSGRELPDMFYTTDMEEPCKDGSTVWTETITSYYRDDQTGHVVVRGVSRDITDRKQMEEKLRMSEFDLRQAQALAHVGSWRWDIAHDKLLWSDEMYRIYGIAPHAFTGSWQDIIARVVHPEDRARVEEANRTVIEDHNPQLLEYRIVRPDGSVRTVWDETGEMTLDDKGHVSSLIGVALDITERKQAEAQLRQSQKMEAIGTLAGGVAHDFNNLLTGILGNIALMRTSLRPSDPLLENLNGAETAARQAADLTKGLLTFSRSAVVLPISMSITAALDATLALLKQSLPATMEIVRDYEQTVWNVLMDQSQITQILLNLAVNARDAMMGKGTLTIRTRNEAVEEDYVRNHPFARTGEFVHLSVTDTGSGMSSEAMQHLFEPFYTTKPVGSGTGLG